MAGTKFGEVTMQKVYTACCISCPATESYRDPDSRSPMLVVVKDLFARGWQEWDTYWTCPTCIMKAEKRGQAEKS